MINTIIERFLALTDFAVDCAEFGGNADEQRLWFAHHESWSDIEFLHKTTGYLLKCRKRRSVDSEYREDIEALVDECFSLRSFTICDDRLTLCRALASAIAYYGDEFVVSLRELRISDLALNLEDLLKRFIAAEDNWCAYTPICWRSTAPERQ